MRNVAIVIVAACLGLGCSKKPTALEVCAKLTAAGVGSNCSEGKPGGLGAAARDNAQLDLAAPAGKTGQVMTFDKDSDYEATTKAFDAAAVLVGRHRYGSASARVFVQLNSEADQALGDKARGVVESL